MTLHGPNGHELEILSVDDDLLVMEARYTGEGGMPPPHLHPNQAERFEVLEGAVSTVVDGDERRYQAGESFEVPAGVVHQMGGDGHARVRWEVRPALRTAEFFERLYAPGGPGDGEQFLREFEAEFRLA